MANSNLLLLAPAPFPIRLGTKRSKGIEDPDRQMITPLCLEALHARQAGPTADYGQFVAQRR